MAQPTLSTPPASGTATPTTSSLTTTQASRVALANASPQLAPLDASKLRITPTTSPRSVPAVDSPDYATSAVCTDHMITCTWTASNGWLTPELVPFGPLSLSPTASVLHYATSCFEGMKLYRGTDGSLRLFRPDRNCERMASSAARIALPVPDPRELSKLIARLAGVDGPRWLPTETHRGKFLYVRPTLIGDDPTLGVQRPKRALLFVILTLFPDLSDPSALGAANADDGIRGLRLLASREDTVRAWPGGFGAAKVGANYGPTLLAQGEARERGFNQVLWLLGQEARVTEAGASNFFVVIRSAEGKERLLTAPLTDGVILHGVTRTSILALARERLPDIEVVEVDYTMHDLVAAVEEDRLVEAFAAGTAFFVAPVGLIEWRGRQIKVPMEQGTTGKYAALFRGWLEDIMYGRTQHEWGVVVPDEKI